MRAQVPLGSERMLRGAKGCYRQREKDEEGPEPRILREVRQPLQEAEEPQDIQSRDGRAPHCSPQGDGFVIY